MTTPSVLSVVLAIVMATQALLGLALPAAYRDVVEWIRATWYGNVRQGKNSR